MHYKSNFFWKTKIYAVFIFLLKLSIKQTNKPQRDMLCNVIKYNGHNLTTDESHGIYKKLTFSTIAIHCSNLVPAPFKNQT